MGPIGSISRRGAHSGVLKEHRIRVDWPLVCHSGICGVPSKRLHYRITIPGGSPRAGIRRPVGALRRSVFPDPGGARSRGEHCLFGLSPFSRTCGRHNAVSDHVILNKFGHRREWQLSSPEALLLPRRGAETMRFSPVPGFHRSR